MHVTRKIEAGKFKGAIKLASSEDMLADFDDATAYSALLSKHPSPHSNTCIPSASPTPTSFQVSSEMIMAAIQSFLNGSAGGPDKIMPQHLKDLVQNVE